MSIFKSLQSFMKVGTYSHVGLNDHHPPHLAKMQFHFPVFAENTEEPGNYFKQEEIWFPIMKVRFSQRWITNLFRFISQLIRDLNCLPVYLNSTITKRSFQIVRCAAGGVTEGSLVLPSTSFVDTKAPALQFETKLPGMPDFFSESFIKLPRKLITDWRIDRHEGGEKGGKERPSIFSLPSPLSSRLFSQGIIHRKGTTVSKRAFVPPQIGISSQGQRNRHSLWKDQLVGGCLSGESVPLIFTFPSRLNRNQTMEEGAGKMKWTKFTNDDQNSNVEERQDLDGMTVFSEQRNESNDSLWRYPQISFSPRTLRQDKPADSLLIVHSRSSSDYLTQYKGIRVPSTVDLRKKETLLLPAPPTNQAHKLSVALGNIAVTGKEMSYSHGVIELIELTRPNIRGGFPSLEAITV